MSAPPDEDLLLPSTEQRTWLATQLAALVAARGYEHLVLAPLIEPTERFFPDRWAGGEASLRRVVRRLMQYADLGELEVEIKLYDDAEIGGPVVRAGAGAAAWFFAVRPGVLAIAARQSAMKDPFVLVPALARAVTEGWRAHHRLTVKDDATEQRLVDLTSVFLGFGLLTTDASIRHSAQRTDGFRLSRKLSVLGVLSPQEMAFALALQLRARALDDKAVRAIFRKLQPNQAGFLRESLRALDGAPELLASLGVPPREQWDEPPDLSLLTAPFDEPDEAAEEPRKDQDRGVVGMNEGRPVFLVERSKATRWAKLLGLPVAMLGMLAGRANMGVEISMGQVGLIAAGLAVLGLVVGSFFRDRRCSEPKCGQALTADQTRCPRCGGEIVGTIAHPKERLAAEDAWRRDHPDAPSPS